MVMGTIKVDIDLLNSTNQRLLACWYYYTFRQEMENSVQEV